MDRRDFLLRSVANVGLRPVSDGDPIVAQATLDEHTTPLSKTDVLHLLRRMGFGPSPTQASQYVGRTATSVVQELLDEASIEPNSTPGQWIDRATENPLGADLQTRFAIEAQWRTNMASFANWWISAMVNDRATVEKLTLFWSSHFTTEFSFDESYSVPQTLWRQYLLFRKDRLGSFRDMVLDVTMDNAMVWYLGGHFNEKGRPNENYARELMELYTTGIGWYTEGDVKEAARVLTGWKSSRYNDEPTGPDGIYNVWFDAARHDTGAKQFMGQTIAARTADNNTAFQVRNEEVGRLIDIIFEQRPEAVGRFIADKFYRYYVYSSPVDTDPVILNQLSDAFRASNWNAKTLLTRLLTSQHFFDPAFRGVQIKTPIEFVAGVMRQCGGTVNNPQDWTRRMDQAVMDPPTVFGWPGYRSWISTNSYPVRRQLAEQVIASMSDSTVLSLVQAMPEFTNAKKLVEALVEYFLPVAISEERMNRYVGILLRDNTPDYEWPQILQSPADAGSRVRAVLVAISRAPDFQLC
ncbi:MAG: DUF1800 domain-containing protein [Candidatus Kapabacteria bacterium]|nr:DUF1800 domain-containing protein [Candidatus Kapabacteria bacterium]